MKQYKIGKYLYIKDGHCLNCGVQARRYRKRSYMCSIVFSQNRNCYSIMYVIFVLLFVLQSSSGFNLDVSVRAEFTGATGSYFGYSAAMLNKPPTDRW